MLGKTLKITALSAKTGGIFSIKRQLLLRLIIAASVISIVLAGAVFIIEFNRLGSLVNGRASQIVASFNTQIRYLLDTPLENGQSALPQELKMLLIAGKSNQWMGQLVYSGIYDLYGREIATEIDNQYAHMEDVEDLLQSLQN